MIEWLDYEYKLKKGTFSRFVRMKEWENCR